MSRLPQLFTKLPRDRLIVSVTQRLLPELARIAVADSATAVAAEFALRQGAGALVCTSGGVHATLTDMVQKRILHAIITV
jgi:hypothetical protein